MKKIAKITLKNLQPFKALTIDFTEDITTLVGDNNTGKSTVIRALYWLFTNSPSGDWMCKEVNGKLKTASVRMVDTEGNAVKRIRGPKINRYILNGDKFDKFGRDVPEPIKEYFGKLGIQCGNVELRPFISMDEEQPFLIFESGPVRGSVLNYLTGIDVADKIKKSFSKEAGALKKEQKVKKQNIKELKTKLKKFKNLEELQGRETKVQGRLVTLIQRENKLEELKELSGKLSEIKKGIKFNKGVLEKAKPVQQLADRLRAKEQVLKGVERLVNAYRGIATLKVIKSRLKGLKILLDTVAESEEKLKLVQKAIGIGETKVKLEKELVVLREKLSKYKKCKKCGSVIGVKK